MEIIEIGAVRIVEGKVTDEYQSMVKPVLHPVLSDFCKELTTISQVEVDGAAGFEEVYRSFMRWIGTEPFVFASWGRYDLKQMKLDVARHQLAWNVGLERHINIKHSYAAFRQVKACGMEKALSLAKLPLEGTHHRGLDDARNIARITLTMIDWLIEKEPILLGE
jgi:3'-5' exoribonuclease 1